MNTHRPVVLIAALAVVSCAAPEVTVEKAWIRTPPPGTGMTAAYFVLRNETAEPVILIGAASDDFASVTLHESRLVDGRWEMTRLDALSVGAGENISLHPGGPHLMMHEPQRSVARGQKATIRLEFAGGRLMTIPAVVQDSAP